MDRQIDRQIDKQKDRQCFKHKYNDGKTETLSRGIESK